VQIENSVALVTGANRGLGLAFVQALLTRGTRKVYAAARDTSSIQIPGVEVVQLDVTSAGRVRCPVARHRYVSSSAQTQDDAF